MSAELVVIKVGTAVLTRDDATLDGAALLRLVDGIARVVDRGIRCLVVTSGAVGAGVSAFGLHSYPSDLATRQAVAAVGQSRLMHAYENLFDKFRLRVAQVLRTADDFDDPRRRQNTRAMLQCLLDTPTVVPVLNQNDSVAHDGYNLGDNDWLAANVAELLGADLLVLMSSVDGLHPPGETDGIVREVDDIDSVLGFARPGETGHMSRGGMASKLRAIKRAVHSGVETCIANGRRPEQLESIVDGGGMCTRFPVPPDHVRKEACA